MRRLLVLFFRLFLIVIILTLPVFSLGLSGFLLFKTYNVAHTIAKEGYLEKTPRLFTSILPGQRAAQKDGSKTELLLSQARQALGREKIEFKYGQPDRINILALGKASKDYPGSNLTDTLLLISINPQTFQTAMLSLPRDLYVQIPDSRRYTKLNAIYHYGQQAKGEGGGIKYLGKVVKEITGQPVDYFIALDFHGFERVIDEIGGIDVNVEKTLHDERYPGPNYSYQTFHLAEGPQHLDGVTALKYVRMRHDPDGDFGRARRQQQVIEAVRQKFLKLSGWDWLGKINSLLSIIEANLETDIPLDEYGSFLALAKNISPAAITNKVIDNRGPSPLLVSASVIMGGRRGYILKPAVKDYSQIKELAQSIFDLTKIERQQKERAAEKATVILINPTEKTRQSDLALTLKNHLQKLGFTYGAQTVNLKEDLSLSDQTLIIDQTDGLKPFSFDYLAKIFHPMTVVSKKTLDDLKIEENLKADLKSNDFVIILGKNSATILSDDGDVDLPEQSLKELEAEEKADSQAQKESSE